jgi:hypothetical protein
MMMVMVQCSASSDTDTPTYEKLNIDIETPKIQLNHGQIIWDEIDGVTEYEVLIVDFTPNDSCYIIERDLIHVTDHSYNIESLTENHQWDIKVRAVIDHEYSLYSEPILIDTFKDLNITYDVSYNIQSNHEYVVIPNVLNQVLFIKYVAQDEEHYIQRDDYKVENDHLYIKQTALNFIESQETFTVYTKAGIDQLIVSKIDSSTPRLLNDSYTSYLGDDLVFVFDLAGGSFNGFIETEISFDDYSFDDNVLIINHQYIDDLFEADMDRDSIVLTYQLIRNDDIYEGYIYIHQS